MTWKSGRMERRVRVSRKSAIFPDRHFRICHADFKNSFAHNLKFPHSKISNLCWCAKKLSQIFAQTFAIWKPKGQLVNYWKQNCKRSQNFFRLVSVSHESSTRTIGTPKSGALYVYIERMHFRNHSINAHGFGKSLKPACNMHKMPLRRFKPVLLVFTF